MDIWYIWKSCELLVCIWMVSTNYCLLMSFLIVIFLLYSCSQTDSRSSSTGWVIWSKSTVLWGVDGVDDWSFWGWHLLYCCHTTLLATSDLGFVRSIALTVCCSVVVLNHLSNSTGFVFLSVSLLQYVYICLCDLFVFVLCFIVLCVNHELNLSIYPGYHWTLI